MGYTDYNYDFAGIGALQKQDADGDTTEPPREVAEFVDER
jgi:hypothetical protein